MDSGPTPQNAPHTPAASGACVRLLVSSCSLIAPFILGVLITLPACGGRTDLRDSVDAHGLDGPTPNDEECNGADDDLDGLVDEEWRDEQGHYLSFEHCAGCDQACEVGGPNVVAVDCLLIEETAICAATECEPGFAPSRAGQCVPLFAHLCLSCLDDGDCGGAAIAGCLEISGEQRCVVGCDFGCPDGYSCQESLCVPQSGSCSCGPGDSFNLACALRDPEDERCPGQAMCTDGELSDCRAPAEVCDELDNDCDGTIDETFRDARGAYILDIHHCGECGVDCTTSRIPEGDLHCGGDPFAPACVLLCPDTLDGLQPGDRVDADLDIANGCECTLSSPIDEPGPVLAVGEDLDVNCDGADGIVIHSVYVAPHGEDDWPGSPTRPVKTIARGLEIASDSLDTAAPRDHVFIASGSYAESIVLVDGVLIHGGYRSDFLALDPSGFRVEVRAPSATTAPGGAAFVGENVGARPSRLQWMTFFGRDSTADSEASFGGVLINPGRALELLDLEIIAGLPGSGRAGMSGERGGSSTMAAIDGALPRGAREDRANICQAGGTNVVEGGRGGMNTCASEDVGGGQGGSPSCPAFAEFQPGGTRGRGVAAGNGGQGGQDSRGPIMGRGCPTAAVCCGLADFTVPTDFMGPQSGTRGSDGRLGRGGGACSDAFGRFEANQWIAEGTVRGTNGSAGSGGGGGGAGGGAEMVFMNGICEFADGLGGGGGGGGAGGCGGLGGEGGSSGGPSVALLVRVTDGARIPQVERVIFRPRDGGRGGDGGGGGDGGQGGVGGLGAELPRAARSTPTLSGPFAGGRGGQGGLGGSGGGGGGGCGGGSVGVWITGARAVVPWETTNTFSLGQGGLAGLGGGGGAPGADGMQGGTVNVLVR